MYHAVMGFWYQQSKNIPKSPFQRRQRASGGGLRIAG